MIVAFAGQVPKSLAYPNDIEDAIGLGTASGRVAICDGASESFDSQSWARLLASRFAVDARVSMEWISDAVREYEGKYDLATLSWSKFAAFERGSFATLLGLEYLPDEHALSIFAIGDTIAALLDGSDHLQTFAYCSSLQFEMRPTLLATNGRLNDSFSAEELHINHRRLWQLSSLRQPVVLCMTDALGQWALHESELGTPVWDQLMAIADVADLETLVLHERSIGRMRVDDVTLVRLAFLGDQRDELPNA